MKYLGHTLEYTTLEECRAAIRQMAQEKAAGTSQSVAKAKSGSPATLPPVQKERPRSRPVSRWEYTEIVHRGDYGRD